jgi:predicted signal transduction protein with EAL and GGDEF domain
MVMAEDEIALAVGAFQADAPRWQEMARALRTRLDAQFERRAVLIQVGCSRASVNLASGDSGRGDGRRRYFG